MDGADELIAPIATNPVIQALALGGVCSDPILRFSLSRINNHIHPSLAPFTIAELSAITDTLDYWQFPVSWSSAVAEEVAFKQFLETNVIPPLLRERGEAICSCYPKKFFFTVEDIFSHTTASTKDIYLGRKRVTPALTNTHKFLEFILVSIHHKHDDIRHLLLTKCYLDRNYLTERLYCLAAQEDDVVSIYWLNANGFPVETIIANGHPLAYAANNGNVDAFRALCEIGFDISRVGNNGEPYAVAIRHLAFMKGRVSVLEFLRTAYPHLWTMDPLDEHLHGVKSDVDTLNWCIAHGWNPPSAYLQKLLTHLEVEIRQWALDNGAVWTNDISVLIAEKRDLKTLKWAISKGCPVNELTVAAAARNFLYGTSSTKTLQLDYLLSNGYPYVADDLYNIILPQLLAEPYSYCVMNDTHRTLVLLTLIKYKVPVSAALFATLQAVIPSMSTTLDDIRIAGLVMP